MDNEASKPDTSPSELGAYEAMAATNDSDVPAQDEAPTCPTCGRRVERGFKFCDGCGNPLEVPVPAETEAVEVEAVAEDVVPDPGLVSPAQQKTPMLERWRQRRAERSQPAAAAPEPVEISDRSPDDSGLLYTPADKTSESVLDRWRRRRNERSELAEAQRSLYDAPPRLEPTAQVIESPEAPMRPSGAVSRAVPAEELRGARPAIGGRLRWSPDEGSTTIEEEPSAPAAAVEEPDAAAAWRPLPIPTWEESKPAGFRAARFGLYVAIAFLAGAIVLGAVTVVGSLVSEGSVAVLEMRGLPIFIGGATSIVVFALLSTGRRNRALSANRSSSILGVLAGLVALIALAALLYQPGVGARVQPRIDRALGIFGAGDEASVRGFQQDIVEWNEDSDQYHALLEASLRRGIDFNRFRQRAGEFEGALVDLAAQMRTHARDAQHPELRDALDDLASIYEDQLGGLRLVNRGLLVDSIDLVRTGNRRYGDARNRLNGLYRTQLRPLLDRAGLDADAFGQALGS